MVQIIKLDEVPERLLSIGRGRWIDENLGASKFALIFAEIEPGLPRPKYHYHEGREHMHVILEGEARFTVEGEEYLVEANTVVLTPPGERHRWENVGDTVLRFMEVYSPLEPDEVNLEDS